MNQAGAVWVGVVCLALFGCGTTDPTPSTAEPVEDEVEDETEARAAYAKWRERYDSVGFRERVALFVELGDMSGKAWAGSWLLAKHARVVGELKEERDAYAASLPLGARVERAAAVAIGELAYSLWLPRWDLIQELDAAPTPSALTSAITAAKAYAGEQGAACFEAWETVLEPAVKGRQGWLAYEAWRAELMATEGIQAQLALAPELESVVAPYAQADPGLEAACRSDLSARLGKAAKFTCEDRVDAIRAAWADADLETRIAWTAELAELESQAKALEFELEVDEALWDELVAQLEAAEAALPDSELGLETTLERTVLSLVRAGAFSAWSLRSVAAEVDGYTARLEPVVPLRNTFSAWHPLLTAYENHVRALVAVRVARCQRRGRPLEAKTWDHYADRLAGGGVGLDHVEQQVRAARKLQVDGVTSLVELFDDALEHPEDDEALRAIALPIWSDEDRQAVAKRHTLATFTWDPGGNARRDLRYRVQQALRDRAQAGRAFGALNAALAACADPWVLVWRGSVVDATGGDGSAYYALAAGLLAPFDAASAELARSWARGTTDRQVDPLAAESGYRRLVEPKLETHRAWRKLAASNRLAQLELQAIEREWETELVRSYHNVHRDIDYDDAVDRAGWLLARDPADVPGLKLRVRLCDDEDTDTKLRLLNEVLELDPFDIQARISRGKILMAQGDLLGVADVRSVQKAEDRDIAMAMLAKQIAETERQAAVRAQLPPFACYDRLGNELQTQRRWISSAYCFRMAEASLASMASELASGLDVPQMRHLLLSAAGSNLISGPREHHDPATALAFLEQALQHEAPKLADYTRIERVRALVRLRRGEEALADAQALVSRLGDIPDAWYQVAAAAALVKDESAIDEAKRALMKLDLHNADHYYMVGVAYQDGGFEAPAVAAFDLALSCAERTKWSASDVEEVRERVRQLHGDALAALEPRHGAEGQLVIRGERGGLDVVEARVLGVDHKRLLQSGYWLNDDLTAVATSTRSPIGMVELRYRDASWDCSDMESARVLGVIGGGDTPAFVVQDPWNHTYLIVGGARSAPFPDWDPRAGFRCDPSRTRIAVIGVVPAAEDDVVLGAGRERRQVLVVDQAVSEPYDEVRLPWFGADGYAAWARQGDQTFKLTATGAEPFAGAEHLAGGGQPGFVFETDRVTWASREPTPLTQPFAWGVLGDACQHPYVLAQVDDALVLERSGARTVMQGWTEDALVFLPLVAFSDDGAHSLVLTLGDGRGVLYHDGDALAGGGAGERVGGAPALSADGSWVAYASAQGATWTVTASGLARRTPGDVAIGDRFTRSYPASPGHDGPAVVRQVAISADGTHVAWLAVHGSGVGLYLDGQAVFETGPGDRIFERTLGFTAGGELVAVVQRAGRNALVYGSDRYPLPSNSRVHLRLAPVGERGVRLATFHLRPDGQRVFVSLTFDGE